MIKRLIAVAAILVLALPGLLLAKGVDLYTMFPNLILGSDPAGTDSVYVTCAGINANTVTMAVHVVTDNADPNDALQAVDLELQVTVDQAGVTLDTTVATVYSGSAVQTWDDSLLSVAVFSGGGPPNGDPSVFPLQLKLGAVDIDASDVLGAGDYLFATLVFNVSSPTNISADGTNFQDGEGTLVTKEANGYSVLVSGETCGPIVPTLSEWGLILFGMVLFGGMVWYLRRNRTATVTA